jgi:hypothetical protein
MEAFWADPRNGCSCASPTLQQEDGDEHKPAKAQKSAEGACDR